MYIHMCIYALTLWAPSLEPLSDWVSQPPCRHVVYAHVLGLEVRCIYQGSFKIQAVYVKEQYAGLPANPMKAALDDGP